MAVSLEEGVSDGVDQLFAAVSNVYGSVNAGIDPETGQFILTDVNTQDRIVGFEISFLYSIRALDQEFMEINHL